MKTQSITQGVAMSLKACGKSSEPFKNPTKYISFTGNKNGSIDVFMKTAPEKQKELEGNIPVILKKDSMRLDSYKTYHYMSKANDVKAYRFNPNGTDEEILANNPGVFQREDGRFCIPNKWNAEEPYLIDASKEQMIMLYGGDDMAVCDGEIFNASYVDTQGFQENGALNYQNPSNLAYGEIVNVTKQAPGSFKVLPVGVQIQTLEGVRTVGIGEVVAFDVLGNPYVAPAKNIIKRNIVNEEALSVLSGVIANSEN